MEKLCQVFKNIAIERLFVCFALLFGLIYLFVIPPFQNVDEPSHYYRVINIVKNSELVKYNNEVGAYLPEKYSSYANQYLYLLKNIDAKVKKVTYNNSDEQKFTGFSNTALYAPLTYLQILPIAYLSNFIDFSPNVLLYLMRLSSLLAYIFIGYYVIKILPIGKLATFVLLLTPMSLSVGASVSSDIMVIGLNFLWCAYILKLSQEDKKLLWFNVLILIILASAISVCKSYFILIFLVFLLPIKQVGQKKMFYLTCLSVILAGVVCGLLWVERIKDFIVPLNGVANPFEQLDFIKNNPLIYLFILIKSFIFKLPRILITMVGVLGWQDTRLDFWTYFIYPIMFYSAIKSEFNENFCLKKYQYGIIAFIFIIGCAIISTYMYLSWTAVGAYLILGLNGKYFLPIMLLPIALFTNHKTVKDLNQKLNCKVFICVILGFCLITSIFSIVHRFYGLTPNLYYSV